MKIPKYIDTILKKRRRYASLLMDVSCALDDWLDKNNIECEEYDICTGVEMYVNPFDSERRVREAILKHKNI
jgi:hypothetical protein